MKEPVFRISFEGKKPWFISKKLWRRLKVFTITFIVRTTSGREYLGPCSVAPGDTLEIYDDSLEGRKVDLRPEPLPCDEYITSS